jgi:hypothetical protein
MVLPFLGVRTDSSTVCLLLNLALIPFCFGVNYTSQIRNVTKSVALARKPAAENREKMKGSAAVEIEGS